MNLYFSIVFSSLLLVGCTVGPIKGVDSQKVQTATMVVCGLAKVFLDVSDSKTLQDSFGKDSFGSKVCSLFFTDSSDSDFTTTGPFEVVRTVQDKDGNSVEVTGLVRR